MISGPHGVLAVFDPVFNSMALLRCCAGLIFFVFAWPWAIADPHVKIRTADKSRNVLFIDFGFRGFG